MSLFVKEEQLILTVHGPFTQAEDFVANRSMLCIRDGEHSGYGGWEILKPYFNFPEVGCVPGLVMRDTAQESSTTIVEFCGSSIVAQLSFLKFGKCVLNPIMVFQLFIITFSNKGAVVSLIQNTTCLVNLPLFLMQDGRQE